MLRRALDRAATDADATGGTDIELDVNLLLSCLRWGKPRLVANESRGMGGFNATRTRLTQASSSATSCGTCRGVAGEY